MTRPRQLRLRSAARDLARTRLGRRIVPPRAAHGIGTFGAAATTTKADGRVVTTASPSVTTRFILLSEQRSGSTLLGEELDRRWTEIRTRGELFNPAHRDPSASFEDIACSAFDDDSGAKIVGFKLFGTQVTQQQLTALLQVEGIRVVILRRRDQLSRYVSNKIAIRTGRWREDQSAGPIESIPVEQRAITVDIEELRTQLQISHDNFREFERLTVGIPRIDVWYEDFSADLNGELRRIATFLGAGEPAHESPPRLVRQNPEPLGELITNFEEVSRFLRNAGLSAAMTDEGRSTGPSVVDHRTASWQPCWPTQLQRVLLRAALAPEETFDALWGEWVWWTNSGDGNEDFTALHPAIHQRLRRSHAAHADVREFRVESTRNTALKIRLLESLRNMVDDLSAADLEIILIGPTALLAMDTDRDGIGFRSLTMSGLDLTARFHQFDRVVQFLTGLGWAILSGPDAITDTITMHREGLELRVHRRMLTSSSASVPDGLDQDLRADLAMSEVLGPSVHLPAASDLLVSTITDGLFERPAGSIGWILDAHHLVSDRNVVLDWSRIVDRTETHGLGAPMKAAIHLLNDLADGLLTPPVISAIDSIQITDQQQARFNEMMRVT